MNRFSNAWSALIGRKASATGSLVAQQTLGRPVWTAREFEPLAREGYEQNIIVYRCISLIAENAASVPWQVFRGERELDQHPALDLLRRPNPEQSGKELMTAAYSYELLAGRSFLEAVGPDGRPPRELYALRPDRVKPVVGQDGLIAAFEFRVGGKTLTFLIPEGGPSPILFMRRFSPLRDFDGQAPLEAAARSVDSHNEATKWNKAVLQNAAMPSGALVTAAGETLSDDAFNRLKVMIDEQYTGARNAGRPLLLEGGIEWVQMMLTQKDVDWLNGKALSAREIALAFGVPEQLVGVPGSLTFANYEQARLALWEEAVIPLLSRWSESLTNWLQQLFRDPQLRVGFDLDSISALEPRRRSLFEKVQRADFLTLNEKRVATGYGEIAGADQILINASMVPVSAGEDAGAGAGFEAIVDIAERVAAGRLPPDAARALLRMVAPELPADQVEAIIAPPTGQ